MPRNISNQAASSYNNKCFLAFKCCYIIYVMLLIRPAYAPESWDKRFLFTLFDITFKQILLHIWIVEMLYILKAINSVRWPVVKPNKEWFKVFAVVLRDLSSRFPEQSLKRWPNLELGIARQKLSKNSSIKH